MEFIKSESKIILNRKLSELDKFVLDFIKILEKHVNYVIISGYVSILLGRSRATEDIDIFIKRISEPEFLNLYEDLVRNDFWCLNTSNSKEMFDYLKDGLAIRFAKKDTCIPNFEVKFPKDSLDENGFAENLSVILPEGKLIISSLERHVAFKKYYLKSKKDIEDSVHIEELFKGKIDYDKVNKLAELIKLRNKIRKEVKK